MSDNILIKTKKLYLQTPNKKQQQLIADAMREYRLYYNDLLFLFKTISDIKLSNTRLLERGALQSEIPDPKELIKKQLMFSNFDYSDSFINQVIATKFNNYMSLTYLSKYSNRNLLAAARSQVAEEFAKTIDTFYKNLKKSKFTDIRYKSIKKEDYIGIRTPIKYNKDDVLFFPLYSGGKRGGVKLKVKDSGGYYDRSNANIRTAAIKKEGDKYYLCLTIKERSRKLLSDNKNEDVGLDWGVAKLATLSNGRVFDALPKFKKESLIKATQQQLSQQKKFGKNWRKTVVKLSKLKKQEANHRKTYIEQTTNEISKYRRVYNEDLKISNMTKSAKGDEENHGKNVKQKSGLNRVILNHSPYFFNMRLEQKMKERGNTLIKVNPRNTSRTCPKCSHVSADNRKTQSEFKCVKCGYEENADLVAAINIKISGQNKQ